MDWRNAVARVRYLSTAPRVMLDARDREALKLVLEKLSELGVELPEQDHK